MADTTNQIVARELDKQMKAPIRQILQAPKLFAKQHRLPKGKTVARFDQITDMGSSLISFEYPEGRWGDSIKTTPREVKCAYHVRKYKIRRSKVDGFLSEGKDLPAEAAISAAQKNVDALETTLMTGWKPDGTLEKVIGLYLAAGNTFGGGSFGTAGNAIAAVAGLKGEFSTDKVRGVNWNLSLHPDQRAELDGSILSNGDREEPHVLNMLNSVKGQPLGQIFESTELTAATGMMSPVDPTGLYMDLVIAEDFTNLVGLDNRESTKSPLFGSNYVAMAPRFMHTDGSDTVAVGTLTGI